MVHCDGVKNGGLVLRLLDCWKSSLFLLAFLISTLMNIDQGHHKILNSHVRECWHRRETLNKQIKKEQSLLSQASRSAIPPWAPMLNVGALAPSPPFAWQLIFTVKPGGGQQKPGSTEGMNSELEMDLNQTPGSEQNFTKGQAGGWNSAPQPNL